MKTRRRILSSLAIAILLASLTALLLLGGHVSAAMWMEGPYFPLSLILPGSVDTLPAMVVVVAAYYFVASLVAFTNPSPRTVVFVVLIVLALNTLGSIVWHRQVRRFPGADGLTARQHQAACATAAVSDAFQGVAAAVVIKRV